MRQLVMVVLLLFAGNAVAQEPASRGGLASSHFGAPALKFTGLRGQPALMFGGRGGFSLSESLQLGGSLFGTLTQVDAREGAVIDAPGALDVKLETFGLDLEYALKPAEPTHAVLGITVGGGAAHYVRDGTSEQHGETDFVLLVEPAAGVERSVAGWLRLNLSASYRLVRGVEQPGLTEGDVRGPSVALAIKIGRF